MSTYVNVETGELIDELSARAYRNGTDGETKVAVTLRPGEQITKVKPKAFDKRNDFTMVFHASNRELIRKKALSDDEKSLLFSLLIFLDYDQYAKDEQAFFFNVGRVAELMGWSRQRAGRILDGLCARDKRLIAYTRIGREKYYMFNPNFIYRGDTSALRTAIRLFEQAAIDEDTSVD